MIGAWRLIRRWLSSDRLRQREIPEALWQQTLKRYAFLTQDPHNQAPLRGLASQFLAQKEFQGAGGLVVTDQMAVAIAAQACLPLVHMKTRPGRIPLGQGSPLVWYSDFVGIVVHPGEVVARRESIDESGIVHTFEEVISGEAMDHGPVMLSWADVDEADVTFSHGYNVVVHEFAHKLDMADGTADGCPALQAGFLGCHSASDARRQWFSVWQAAYEVFCERVVIAERFGGPKPWLDAYGTQDLAEFFAVACEAYFVNRVTFAREFPTLMPALEAFFGDGNCSTQRQSM
jgi:Mlc titration factor MtfA (ptsG expression regulator)